MVEDRRIWDARQQLFVRAQSYRANAQGHGSPHRTANCNHVGVAQLRSKHQTVCYVGEEPRAPRGRHSFSRAADNRSLLIRQRQCLPRHVKKLSRVAPRRALSSRHFWDTASGRDRAGQCRGRAWAAGGDGTSGVARVGTRAGLATPGHAGPKPLRVGRGGLGVGKQ